MRILVIDDYGPWADEIAELCTRIGHSDVVVVRPDKIAALGDRNLGQFDLAFVDANLDADKLDMSEALEAAHLLASCAKVLVVMSALHDEATLESAFSAVHTRVVPIEKKDLSPGAVRALLRTAEAGSHGTRASIDILIQTVMPDEEYAVESRLARFGDWQRRTVGSNAPRIVRSGVFEFGAGRPLEVCLFQTRGHGNLAASLSIAEMYQHFDPRLHVLLGKAGAVADSLALGDVVIASEMTYYEPRAEASDGIRRRPRSARMSPNLVPIIEDFLSQIVRRDRQSQSYVRGYRGRLVRVRYGALAAGEAVVKSSLSDVRRYLLAMGDAVLAVETESAGVADAFEHLELVSGTRWGGLVIRGVSDLADKDKDDRYAFIATANAADCFVELLKYIEW